METRKSRKDSPSSPASNGPLKVLRIEDVSASIFARTHRVQGEDVTFYSVSVSRSYVDAQGVRRYSKSFDQDDLGKLATLIQRASEFLHDRQAAEPAA